MDEIIELLNNLMDEWEEELNELTVLSEMSPEIEIECFAKKELIEEHIQKIRSIIEEFSIIE